MDLVTREYESLCEGVAGLAPSIIVSAVLSRGKVLASRVRPGIFIPEGKALDKILLQLDLLVGIPRTNEKAFGKVGYVVVNHGSGDHILFPLEGGHVMVVSVAGPYTHQLIQNVQRAIQDVAVRTGQSRS
ncbi:hypothetical protein [Nitrososphaera sp.]|uniref:hypothetical protein n=1 Tax=Nitrososphaera sp. TaxID=1971748 RepID=UPI00180945C6|nr:hypothetical protein [Nitrososphaera sp.]NWG37702.1 hypothetical protein [Nitrososphaera sp.]